jgi:tRNA pseudouridine55 synthase
VNKATRLAPFFSDLDKEYAAVMKLGESTDTQDACGTVIECRDAHGVSRAALQESLEAFTGTILQKPPMFSALKHKGKALYTYARSGIEIERPSREVTVRKISLTDFSPPYASFTVRCSKGTYVRTLCNDIGMRLGTGAHLHALERTAIGNFTLGASLTMEQLQGISAGDEISSGVYTMDEALLWVPEYVVRESSVKAVIHGNPVDLGFSDVSNEVRSAEIVRVKSPDGTLLAIGAYDAVKNAIKMKMVFA